MIHEKYISVPEISPICYTDPKITPLISKKWAISAIFGFSAIFDSNSCYDHKGSHAQKSEFLMVHGPI